MIKIPKNKYEAEQIAWTIKFEERENRIKDIIARYDV